MVYLMGDEPTFSPIKIRFDEKNNDMSGWCLVRSLSKWSKGQVDHIFKFM